MPRPSAAAAILALTLVAACDLPFLPEDDWVDVSWRLTTVDGQSSVGSSFTRPVGTYVYDSENGSSAAEGLGASQIGWFGHDHIPSIHGHPRS